MQFALKQFSYIKERFLIFSRDTIKNIQKDPFMLYIFFETKLKLLVFEK